MNVVLSKQSSDVEAPGNTGKQNVSQTIQLCNVIYCIHVITFGHTYELSPTLLIWFSNEQLFNRWSRYCIYNGSCCSSSTQTTVNVCVRWGGNF